MLIKEYNFLFSKLRTARVRKFLNIADHVLEYLVMMSDGQFKLREGGVFFKSHQKSLVSDGILVTKLTLDDSKSHRDEISVTRYRREIKSRRDEIVVTVFPSADIASLRDSFITG